MKKKVTVFALILVFLFALLMTGCGGGGDILTKEQILELSDEDLSTDLYIQILWEELDEDDYEASIRAMNEAKQKFYILTDFDTEYYSGGLAEYLYWTDFAFIEDTEELLREFGFTEMADKYGSFFDENEIDIEKYLGEGEDAIDALEADYPIAEFNEEFDAIYDYDELTAVLADYVRENVEEFV